MDRWTHKQPENIMLLAALSWQRHKKLTNSGDSDRFLLGIWYQEVCIKDCKTDFLLPSVHQDTKQ